MVLEGSDCGVFPVFRFPLPLVLQLQALPWHRIASRRDLAAWAWSRRCRQSVVECAAMRCEKTLQLDSSVWPAKTVAAAAAEPTLNCAAFPPSGCIWCISILSYEKALMPSWPHDWASHPGSDLHAKSQILVTLQDPWIRWAPCVAGQSFSVLKKTDTSIVLKTGSKREKHGYLEATGQPRWAGPLGRVDLKGMGRRLSRYAQPMSNLMILCLRDLCSVWVNNKKEWTDMDR